jgi:recombinational DNA repair protein RecR
VIFALAQQWKDTTNFYIYKQIVDIDIVVYNSSGNQVGDELEYADEVTR